MYQKTGFAQSSFGLFAALRAQDSGRLTNNVELLMEDVEEHLADVGPAGLEGFDETSMAHLQAAASAAREVVALVKARAAGA